MKTPEQMAEEYVATETNNLFYREPLSSAFLAGYQAAKELYAAKLKEANDTVAGMADECEGLKTIIYDYDKTNLPKPAKWISVKDRLPEVNTDVLVKVSKGWVESDDNGNNPKPLTYDFYSVMSLYYENNQHVWDTRPVTDACPLKWEYVTHWMPLPEPPKEAE